MVFLDALPEKSDQYNELLQEIGWVMANDADTHDLLIPYSYMNVAIVLRQMHPSDVESGAQRIREEIGKHSFNMNGRDIKTTASVGVANYPRDASSASELLQKAGAALLSARKKGDAVVLARE